jgi:uncharacterized damage-inducible protein DinB
LFPSLEDIFLQVVEDNVWWFESVPENRQESQQEIKSSLPSEELRKQTDRIERIGRTLAASLTPARLNESYVVRGVQGNGKPFEMRVNLRTIIWHMVEEELQRRGELNALLWQIGVEAPVYDWIEWDHEVGRIQDPRSK